jgi:hypothetical protein
VLDPGDRVVLRLAGVRAALRLQVVLARQVAVELHRPTLKVWRASLAITAAPSRARAAIPRTRSEAGAVSSGGGPLFSFSTATTSLSAVGGIERVVVPEALEVGLHRCVTGPATSRSRSR